MTLSNFMATVFRDDGAIIGILVVKWPAVTVVVSKGRNHKITSTVTLLASSEGYRNLHHEIEKFVRPVVTFIIMGAYPGVGAENVDKVRQLRVTLWK